MHETLDRDVALLAGGDASEHEVSLLSAATLRDALLAAGFRVHSVVIACDGTWNLLPVVAPGQVPADFPPAVPGILPGAVAWGPALEVAATLRRSGVSLAVLGLHGRGGEDGSIQGFLEVAGFAYTGCGVVASAVAIDKLVTKRLMVAAGIPTPPWREVLIHDPGWDSAPGLDAFARELGWPVVVKAPALGSSVEVHIARERDELRAALRSVLGLEGRALLERHIRGREFTVAVIGATNPDPLPVIEIVPRLATWFDAASKYRPGGAEEIVPADVPEETGRALQALARRLHLLIGARGVTRTDLILDGAGQPFVLEINTLPGMTRASLVPKAAAAARLDLPSLVKHLVREARAAARQPAARSAAQVPAPSAAQAAAT